MSNEFLKQSSIIPAVVGQIADPDIYNQNIAGQSKGAILGIDADGNFKDDFDVGDEGVGSIGSLVKNLKLRQGGFLKIYDASGVFVQNVSLAQATETALGQAKIATQAEVDAGTDDLRFITPLKLANATSIIKLGTPVTASGTSIDFTSIPAGVKRISICLAGVSTNGTSPIIIQLGVGSFITSGYSSVTSAIAASALSFTTTNGFILTSLAAADLVSGHSTLKIIDSSKWLISGVTTRPNVTATNTCAGYIDAGGVIDRIRITTQGGSDTFDAGTINIQYE